MIVIKNQEYENTFDSQSHDVIYDITEMSGMSNDAIGMSGMSNDVREECLECHMTSNDVKGEYHITLMTGRCVNKPGQTEPVGCYGNSSILNFTQLCK